MSERHDEDVRARLDEALHTFRSLTSTATPPIDTPDPEPDPVAVADFLALVDAIDARSPEPESDRHSEPTPEVHDPPAPSEAPAPPIVAEVTDPSEALLTPPDEELPPSVVVPDEDQIWESLIERPAVHPEVPDREDPGWGIFEDIYSVTPTAPPEPSRADRPGPQAPQRNAAAAPKHLPPPRQGRERTLIWVAPVLIALAMVVVPVVGVVSGRFQLAPVHTSAMTPALPVGTLMWLEPARFGDPEPGDVVLYQDARARETIGRVRAVDRDRNRGLELDVSTDQQPTAVTTVPVRTADVWKSRFSVPWVGYVLLWTGTPMVRLAATLVVMVTLQIRYVRRRLHA